MSEAMMNALVGAAFEGADVRGDDALARDVLALKGEVERINRAAVVARRPALGGASHASFAGEYLRKGLEGGLEVKRLSGATPGEGGVAVPPELDGAIETLLAAQSPMRRLARVVRVGTANYRKLVATGGFASGWVSETAGRPETATPSFVEVAPPVGELYANPAASQAMLDDAMFDVEGWLAGEVAAEFARAESEAFVTGDGVGKPKGFLRYPTGAAGDGARPFGVVQRVASGAAGAFAADTAVDRLIDVVHALQTGYRQGASWVMNGSTLAALRKLKDADGVPLWRAGLADGQASTLLGYPVFEVDAMPDIADGEPAIAFGNFAAAYLIADRAETSVLRDPFTNKPFVHFYATRRVGGALVNAQAIKLLTFSA